MNEDIEQYQDWLNENDKILFWSEAQEGNKQFITNMRAIYKECAEEGISF